MNWHIVLDPADPELDRLAEQYHLHPLHVEDCRHRRQSAKIEDGEGYLFTVLKDVRLGDDGELETEDLDLFLGPDYLIAVIERDCPEIRELIAEVQKQNGAGRPDQAYYRILDRVVDAYLPVLDHFGEKADGLEDEALDKPSPETLATIFEAKRNLILLRRVLVNMRDVAGRLQRMESPLIARELWPFLRDVYDHVTRNLDTVDVLRDLMAGTLDVYLSSVANRTNQVMKVLTVLGTVALPAVVISGIYGMNVKGLPGAESPYGIAVVFILMCASTVGLIYLLKRFRWF